jgi:RimJ/RimL family protein N-acetyltransferase
VIALLCRVARATLDAIRDAFPDIDEVVAYVDRGNHQSIALMKALGLATAPYQDPHKQLFVWRRDGTSPPVGWEPPSIPYY